MHGGSLPPLNFGRELAKQGPLVHEPPKRPPLDRTTSSGAILRSHGPEFPAPDFLRKRLEAVFYDRAAALFEQHAETFHAFEGQLAWLDAHGCEFSLNFFGDVHYHASTGGEEAVGDWIGKCVADHFGKACQTMFGELPKTGDVVSKANGRNALMRFISGMLVEPGGRFNPTALPHLDRLIWHANGVNKIFDKSWLDHLSARFADLGKQPSPLAAQLNSFASIHPLSPAGERIVRFTLNKPAPQDLTEADQVETALRSVLHVLGQPATLGSCAVSSMSIKVHEDDPGQFLKEFHEVMSAGTVPFGKGKHDVDHVAFNDTFSVPPEFTRKPCYFTEDRLPRSRSIASVLDHLGVGADPHVRHDLFRRACELLPAAKGVDHRKGSMQEIAHMVVLAIHETNPDQLRKLETLESNASLIDGLHRDLQRTSDKSKMRKLTAKVKALAIAQGKLAKPFEDAGIDWRDRLGKIQAQQRLADEALAAYTMPPGLMGWSLTMTTEIERRIKEKHWSDIERACLDKVQRSNPAGRVASREILKVARELYLERVAFSKEVPLGSIMYIQTPETGGRGVRVSNEGVFARVLGDLFAEAAGRVATDRAGAEAGTFLVRYGRSSEFVESVKTAVRRDSARKGYPTEPWLDKANTHQGIDDGVSLITRGVRQPRAYDSDQLKRDWRGKLAPGELLKNVILQGQMRKQSEGAGAGLARERVMTDSHAFNLLVDHPSTAGAMKLGPAALDDWIRKEFEEPARREMTALRNVPDLRQLAESLCSGIPFTLKQKKAFIDAVCQKAAVPGDAHHYTLKRLVRAFRDQLPRTGVKGSLADFEDSARVQLSTFKAFEPKMAVVADTNWRGDESSSRLMSVGFDFFSERLRLFYAQEHHDPLQGRTRQSIGGLADNFERALNWWWHGSGNEPQPAQ